MSPSGMRAVLRPLAHMLAPVARLPERERPIDDAQVRVDLEGAGLHAERPRLARRPGMAVDDHRAHAAAGELVGEHQAGGAGADDQDVGIRGG